MMDHSEFTSFARSTYYKDTGKHEFTKKKKKILCQMSENILKAKKEAI